MSRCDACPVDAHLECGGERRHPRYCDLLTIDPRYRETILARAESRPPVAVPVSAPNPAIVFSTRAANDSRTRVGFLCATRMKTGGTETWHDLFYRSHDRALIAVVGMACAHVERGSEALPDGTVAASGVEAMRSLARSVDVLVTWGIGDLAGILAPVGDPARPVVVAVSHGEARCEYTRKWLAECEADCDAFAAISAATVETIPGSRRATTTIIPNGFDPSKIANRRSRAEVRAEIGVSEDRFVLLYNGRLAGDKRPMLAIDAMRDVPSATLVVAGSGHLADEIGASAGPNVVVLGHRDDTADLLAAADCLVNPSEVEGFGLSMLEAIAAGVPVIASPHGLATMHPGWTRVVPEGESWAGAIRAAIDEHPADLARAETAKAEAVALYGPSAFGRAWSDYFAGLRRPERNDWAEQFTSLATRSCCGG